MKKSIKITVLGGGLWGTVLAQHIASGNRKREVWLWEFFAKAAEFLRTKRRHPHIPGFRLDETVTVTSRLDEAAAGAEVLLFVLPSTVVRATARAARKSLGPGRPVVVNASKGLEAGTLKTMGETIAAELPRARAVYTLSGPSFAREVARGVPTKLVLAGPGGSRAESIVELFNGGALRAQWCADRKGVELGGSLKNALAIGCGILDGRQGRGANTKAALLTQGMSEIGRLIKGCGGNPQTIYGLAGLGDLIATGTSSESRNRSFGEKLGQGKTARQARREIPTVVEGVEAAQAAYSLSRRLGIKVPLLESICKVVHGGKPARLVEQALGFN